MSTITFEQILHDMAHPALAAKAIKGFFENAGKPISDIARRIATLSCVDSRLLPGSVLGHLQSYAIQTIAAISTEVDFSKPFDEQQIEVAAALQYFLNKDKDKAVKEILVMGHTKCGGAKARVFPPANMPYLDQWVRHVCLHGHDHTKLPDIGENPFIKEAMLRASERACLDTSMRNIKTLPLGL